ARDARAPGGPGAAERARAEERHVVPAPGTARGAALALDRHAPGVTEASLEELEVRRARHDRHPAALERRVERAHERLAHHEVAEPRRQAHEHALTSREARSHRSTRLRRGREQALGRRDHVLGLEELHAAMVAEGTDALEARRALEALDPYDLAALERARRELGEVRPHDGHARHVEGSREPARAGVAGHEQR